MTSVDPHTSLGLEALLRDRMWVRELARRLVRDPNAADDLEQDAWTRALTRPPHMQVSARGWFATVLRNLKRDAHRSSQRRETRERVAAQGETQPSAADLAARAEAHRTLIEEVLRLPEPSRTIVLLRFFEDLPHAEIAARLGLESATVRTRLSRALTHLRGRLERRLGRDGHALSLLLLGPPAASALRGPAVTSAAAESIGKGVVIVGTKTKIAAVLVVLLLALFAGAVYFDDAPPPREAAAAPAPDEAPDHVRRRSRHDGDAEAPAESAAPVAADPEPVEPAAAALPDDAEARRRLELTLLPPREPAGPPAGFGASGPRAPRTIDVGGTPSPGPGVRIGGGMRMTGWTKWKSPPVRGSVRLVGRVDDLDGRPLAGAVVYRVDLNAGEARTGVTSFQWIHEIGKTGADGTFAFDGQPEGAWQLAANYHAAGNRDHGLEIPAAVTIDAVTDETVSGLVLRAPVHAGELTDVTGRIVDDAGESLGRTQIIVGFQEVWADANGEFRAEGVPLGDVAFYARKTGYEEVRETVTIRAGGAPVVLRTRFASSGPLELTGTVRDEDGAPLAGAQVFLGGTYQGSRWEKTGKDGVFRFEQLPEAYATRGVRVMVMGTPEGAGWFPAYKDAVTVPSPGLELVVQRTALLHIRVRDADSGALLPQFNVDLKRDVLKDGKIERVGFRSGTYYEDDGEIAVPVPKGTIVMFVEAPGHEPVHASVEVSDTGSEMEAVIEMHPGDDGTSDAAK